jgi:hypothetical protein
MPTARASLLVTNATFLTMKPGETAPVVGYMLVDDNGKIIELAAGAPPANRSIALIPPYSRRRSIGLRPS